VRQLCLILLLVGSMISSGCYAIVEVNVNYHNAIPSMILPRAIGLAALFVIIGVGVALTTDDKDRRGAASQLQA
jgi:ABC-type transport system involved in cytochrome c biogenesis permease component